MSTKKIVEMELVELEDSGEACRLSDGSVAKKLSWNGIQVFATDEVQILYEDMTPRRKVLFLAMLEEYSEFPMIGATFRSRLVRVAEKHDYRTAAAVVEVARE